MNQLVGLRSTIQRITRFVCFTGMFLLIPMMLLTTGEVVGRAVWSRPIPGSLELSSYFLAIFILSGVAYTHQIKGHVRVSMLISRLPERAGLVIEMVTTLLSLCIITIVAWQGLVVGFEERTVSDMLRIPQLPFRLLVSLAGFSLVLELLIDLSVTLGKLRRR